MMYNRIGECNQCGLCCGALRDPHPWPDRRSPFPSNWPSAIRNAPDEYLAVVAPFFKHAGITRNANGELEVTPPGYGQIRLPGNRRFYYIWPQDKSQGSLCADTSPAHDGSAYEPQCPFLKEDPGDGTRPCGLIGTNIQAETYDVWCVQEPVWPRSQQHVDEWRMRYGEGSTNGEYCSYVWEAIP